MLNITVITVFIFWTRQVAPIDEKTWKRMRWCLVGMIVVVTEWFWFGGVVVLVW